MRIFIDGPEVSLKGSPTVSPTTAALCGSLPFPPKCPSSIYFLALSQAPPAFDIIIARSTPDESAPASIPPRASVPITIPTTSGATIAISPGSIISLRAALVEISTHFA